MELLSVLGVQVVVLVQLVIHLLLFSHAWMRWEYFTGVALLGNIANNRRNVMLDLRQQLRRGQAWIEDEREIGESVTDAFRGV